MKFICSLLMLFGIFTFQMVNAQCKTYIPSRAGAVLTYNMADDKGKSTGTQKIEILSVNRGATELKARMTIADVKGKESVGMPYTVQCKNGSMRVDVRALTLSSNPNVKFDAEATATMIEFPAHMKAGQNLPDVTVVSKTSMQGGPTGELEIKITNRKVVAKESMTVPAGTFEAYKIESESSMQMRMAGVGLPASKMKSTEWWVLGVGLIKSETEAKGGIMARLAKKTSMTLTSLK